jgi:hypothetical protein
VVARVLERIMSDNSREKRYVMYGWWYLLVFDAAESQGDVVRRLPFSVAWGFLQLWTPTAHKFGLSRDLGVQSYGL